MRNVMHSKQEMDFTLRHQMLQSLFVNGPRALAFQSHQLPSWMQEIQWSKTKSYLIKHWVPRKSSTLCMTTATSNLALVLCLTSEGVQMWNSIVSSPGEVSRWQEEAQHMSLALGLPWSHRRGAKASWTQEMWNNVWFPDWGTYSVSPPTYIHVLEIKSDIHRKNCSMLLAVHPWYWPTMVCLFVPIWHGWACIGSDVAVWGWWVTGVTVPPP